MFEDLLIWETKKCEICNQQHKRIQSPNLNLAWTVTVVITPNSTFAKTKICPTLLDLDLDQPQNCRFDQVSNHMYHPTHTFINICSVRCKNSHLQCLRLPRLQPYIGKAKTIITFPKFCFLHECMVNVSYLWSMKWSTRKRWPKLTFCQMTKNTYLLKLHFLIFRNQWILGLSYCRLHLVLAFWPQSDILAKD